MLWPVVSCFAQSPPVNNMGQLTIGDTVPDIPFTNVYNYPVSKIRLSDLKGKLIILDFWASWCGNCIRLFPHMDSLQRKFGDQVQIILFNTQSKASHDDEPKIKKIITGLEKRTGYKIGLPVIYDSEELDKYFPSKYVPHEVWLNADRKVIGITSFLEVTEQNISALLNNQKIQLHTKEDVLDYDKNKPLFVNNNGGSGDDFIGRSILTGYKEGLYGTNLRTSEQFPGKVTGLSLLNVSLPVLLETAYAGTGKLEYPKNRKILDIKDLEQFKTHEDAAFYKYSYCYDISVPPAPLEYFHKYMQQDIERLFHITVTVAKRKMNCYILKTESGTKISFSKAAREEAEYEQGSLNKYLHKYKILNVVQFFDARLDYPLINETNLPPGQTIDIDLPFNLKDQGALIQSLEKAGFSIKKEIREMEVVVISDKY